MLKNIINAGNSKWILVAGSAFIGLYFLMSVLQRPSNWEDCILENLKYAKTRKAANLIDEACYKKFPEEKAAQTSKKPKVFTLGPPQDINLDEFEVVFDPEKIPTTK